MVLATKQALFIEHFPGLGIALVIMLSWLIHLSLLLSLNLATTSFTILIGEILLQAFLNTGLFITAHDAIHGLVYPPNHKINNGLGTLCAIAYAGLPYRTLAHNHRLHHRCPASAADPDFHFREDAPQESTSFFPWYQHFIGQYWSWPQFIPMAIALGLGVSIGLSLLNIVLLWGLPLLLSSLQLFYFGTYLPHQTPNTDQNRSASVNPSQARPWLLSLLTCYHFGYHQEHHDHPEVPWWGLPAQYQANRSQRFPCVINSSLPNQLKGNIKI